MSYDDAMLERDEPLWEVMCFDTDGETPIPMYECEECETLFTKVRDIDIQLCPTCYDEEYT